jgi:hypothetical protein
MSTEDKLKEAKEIDSVQYTVTRYWRNRVIELEKQIEFSK